VSSLTGYKVYSDLGTGANFTLQTTTSLTTLVLSNLVTGTMFYQFNI